MNHHELIHRLLLFTNALVLVSSFFHSIVANAVYPEKPIRLIVGAAPGDSPDISSRLFAAALNRQTGHPVVVDNRPGASNTIAFDMIAKAPRDGYTIGWGSFLLATTPFLMPKLPYDPMKDLQMVMQVNYTPNLMAVTPSLPVKSVSELIAYTKQSPGRVSYGSGGVGSSLHLGMELFKRMTGVQMLHVPYKAVQPAIADVIGGQVQVICDNIASIIPYVQANRVRGLAVTSPKRSPIIPNLPTMQEAGVPGFIITPWGGLISPSGLPKAVLMRLNAELNVALESPKLKDFYDSLGVIRVGGTPEQFSEHVKKEMVKWAEVMKRAGIERD